MRVAIIPARGNSVRIPRKNIREFRGHPMVAYAIMRAQDSSLFDEHIYVSTDDKEIADVARGYGAKVIHRPTCDGSIGTQDVAITALRSLLNGGVPVLEMNACVLYPTVPLLTAEILVHSHQQWRCYGTHFMVSVQASPMQDAGCFYWNDVGALMKGYRLYEAPTMAYALPPERCIDINTEEDWARAESMFDAIRHNNMLNERGHV